MASLFSGTIKKAVDDAVGKAISNIIDVNLDNELQKLHVIYYFGGGRSRMNFDIAFNNIAASTYVELANNFGIADNKTGVACPIAPGPLPDLDSDSHEIQLFLAESVLNCAIWVSYTNGAINLDLPSTVSFWKPFIPQLGVLFPGDKMTIAITPLIVQQNVTFDKSGASLALSVAANLTAHNDNTGVSNFACVLEFDAALGLDMWVGPSTLPNVTLALYANVTQIKITVEVLDSAIGEINLGILDTFIAIAEPIVQKFVNAILAIGIPLPVVPGIGLENPSVFFGDGYLGVAADFVFKPGMKQIRN
jgi:hypothetical protein